DIVRGVEIGERGGFAGYRVAGGPVVGNAGARGVKNKSVGDSGLQSGEFELRENVAQPAKRLRVAVERVARGVDRKAGGRGGCAVLVHAVEPAHHEKAGAGV